jgi:hypothetical protein
MKMRERVNKPRAFLSHSSKDVAFVEKIENDLRKCQIECWRDRIEIRDGRRWQQVIFEEGIPTCDVIIALFTEKSLESHMVAKEVDAAQLRQLQDNGIAFLPYVSEDKVRDKLRLDIQSLQCRVWNDANYHEILPSVVAEIWRSYMERAIANAVLQEQNRRLVAELELERLQIRLNESVFTSQEEGEFQHIYTKLKEPQEVFSYVSVQKEIDGKQRSVKIGKCKYKVSLVELIQAHIQKGNRSFSRGFLAVVEEYISTDSCLPFPQPEGANFSNFEFERDFAPTMLILGLVKEEKQTSTLGVYFGHKYSDKTYRFISWLDYHKKAEEKPFVEFIGFLDTTPRGNES